MLSYGFDTVRVSNYRVKYNRCQSVSVLYHMIYNSLLNTESIYILYYRPPHVSVRYGLRLIEYLPQGTCTPYLHPRTPY